MVNGILILPQFGGAEDKVLCILIHLREVFMKHEKQQRVNHTAEFKREAVELVLSSERSVPQIAVELGVSVSNLRRWKREYQDQGE